MFKGNHTQENMVATTLPLDRESRHAIQPGDTALR